MGRTCKGICILHQAEPTPNKVRYDMGQKRCTYCGIFILTEKIRCLCCKTILRTKPRGKKRD